MKAYFDHTSITAVSILFLFLFFLVKYFTFYGTTSITTPTHQHQYHLNNSTAIKTPPPLVSPAPVVERIGIVNENGVMTDDFIVGEFDERLIDSVVNSSDEEEIRDDIISVGKMKIEKFKVCDDSMSEYIPCKKSNSSEIGCPEKGLDCLVPRPKEYKLHIPWPKSRDMAWFYNVPLTHMDQEKGNQIARKEDKLIFPEDKIQFMNGVNQYLDQISKMAPEIAFGNRTRVALDIGCGVGSFGAHLMQRNVTTLSISPKDIQFVLERGVPAMIAEFSTHRLLYPSQAFDLIHCSRCKINWTTNDGILLLEVNRVLRGGGYFVWAAQVVYKRETDLVQQWKEMENLTRSLCWEVVKSEGYIAIWQKPVNNTCYLSRDQTVKPSLCDEGDNPENVWGVNLTRCISRLPANGYGSNVSTWPERLHSPPERLSSIKMDADLSRKEIYKAESKYWNDIVSGYINVFHLKKLNLRNVMDMNARYGGFAAALLDFQVDSWVMNVVPVSGSNTLPVIYDRGLIGVLHDWCDPFDTYPRTYDLLNAAGLFFVEKKRCNFSTIMLEMDRILRPGGRVYIRDITLVIDELEEIAKAMGWVTFMFDTGEGPHSNWKLLNCEKRL